MIQRLHLEEAQPSSFAINAARESNAAEDGTDSESLALEFQALLAQISGQVASIPDQAMAVGLALAQTMVTQRVHEQEHVKVGERKTEVEDRKVSQDTRSSDSKCDNTAKNVVQDKGRREDKQQVTQSDSEDNQSGQDQQTIQDNNYETSGDEQMLQSDQESLGDVLSNLATDTTSVVQNDVQVNEGPIQTAVVEQKAVNQNFTVNTNAEVAVNQVQVETQANLTELHEKHKHKKEKESTDEVDLGQVAHTISDNDRRDFDAGLRFKNSGQNDRNMREVGKETQTLSELAQSNQSADGGSKSQSGDGDRNRAKDAQDLALGLQNQRILEGSQKGQKDAKVSEHRDKESALGSMIPKTPERTAEGSIQMTILRQAFDSLKAGRTDAADARAKTSTPAVNAPTAASATKSTQGEHAAKAARGLPRPQVAKMLERVESTLKEAARSRDGRTISLHLEPVNLGKVKVDVSLREGTLHARIAPENQQVTQALREHAHELQGTLRKLGLDVESVTVSVTSDQFEGEMTTGSNLFDGRSFQEERNNMPQERAQVAENTVGNELADWTRADAEAQGATARTALDHWVA